MAWNFRINGIDVNSAWAPALLLLNALFFGYIGHVQRERSLVLENDGIVVPATIIRYDSGTRRVHNDTGPSTKKTDHFVITTFQRTDGSSMTTKYKIAESFLTDNPVGSTTQVRYVPSDPLTNALEGRNWKSAWKYYAGFAGFNLIIAMFLLAKRQLIGQSDDI